MQQYNRYGQQNQGRVGGGGGYGNYQYKQKQYFKKKFEPYAPQGGRPIPSYSPSNGSNIPAPKTETVGMLAPKKAEQESEFTTYEKIKGNLRNFLDLSTEKQRNILGNLLYPIIQQREGLDLAPKITGMLVDLNVLEVNDVLEFFEDPMKLEERINEAKEIIVQEKN